MKPAKFRQRYEVAIFVALTVLVVTLAGLLLNAGLQGQALIG